MAAGPHLLGAWRGCRSPRYLPLGHTVLNVAGVFGDVAEVLLEKKSLGIRETAKDKGEGVHGVMCQQLEGPAINLVTKILDGAKGC